MSRSLLATFTGILSHPAAARPPCLPSPALPSPCTAPLAASGRQSLNWQAPPPHAQSRQALPSLWQCSLGSVAGGPERQEVRRGYAARAAEAMASRGAAGRVEPKEGQESVWDYPRPPRLEKVPKRITITFNGVMIADTTDGYRVLETSHPPVYYIPQKDIRMEHVTQSPGSSFCEWKGSATYWSVRAGGREAKNAGWSYEGPTPGFRPIRSHVAFYCAPMDECMVGGERAQPQPGGFYGGWVTSDVVGPFKGGAGSWGW